MIADKISNYRIYNLGEKFEAAFKFLTGSSLRELPVGKYAIAGEEVFALVSEYETVPENEKFLEGHRKYIDLQCVISGEELIGYASLGSQEVVSEYNEEKDYLLTKGEAFFIGMEEGRFAVFYPGDLHKPGVMKSKKEFVKKVVIKVAV